MVAYCSLHRPKASGGDETGVPERLEMEITESALVADMESAQIVLGSLRNAGVRISLDNFGTGYSSLYHLRNFKLGNIKIDRRRKHHQPSSVGSSVTFDLLTILPDRSARAPTAHWGIAEWYERCSAIPHNGGRWQFRVTSRVRWCRIRQQHKERV